MRVRSRGQRVGAPTDRLPLPSLPSVCRRKGLNRPDPNPFVPEGAEAGGGGGSPQVLEAARGRLAKLGVHLTQSA